MDWQLDAAEARVLGSLLEKEIATPDYYPLSLNALVNACNQKSNREPVVSYDQDTVETALEGLRAKGLAVRMIGGDSRVPKHGQRFTEKFNLGRREAAVLCVLMLRGPQTVGELRGRSERLYQFEDLEGVEKHSEPAGGDGIREETAPADGLQGTALGAASGRGCGGGGGGGAGGRARAIRPRAPRGAGARGGRVEAGVRGVSKEL